MVEEQADVRNDSHCLAGAAIAQLGGDGGVDVDADGLHPAGQHVTGGDGMQHGAEAEDEAGAVGVLVIGILRLVHVGDRVGQWTVVA